MSEAAHLKTRRDFDQALASEDGLVATRGAGYAMPHPAPDGCSHIQPHSFEQALANLANKSLDYHVKSLADARADQSRQMAIVRGHRAFEG